MPSTTRKVATTKKSKPNDSKEQKIVIRATIDREPLEASVGLMPPVHQVPTTPQFVVELNGKISDAFAELFANEEPAMIENNGKKKYTKVYFLRQHMKEIQHARDLGYSTPQILRALKRKGFEISDAHFKQTIKEYAEAEA